MIRWCNFDTIAMCKTNYGGGGGGKNVPKIDYVIYERPLFLSNKVKLLVFL